MGHRVSADAPGHRPKGMSRSLGCPFGFSLLLDFRLFLLDMSDSRSHPLKRSGPTAYLPWSWLLVLLLSGCTEHKVDTTVKWCEQISAVNLEKKYRRF